MRCARWLGLIGSLALLALSQIESVSAQTSSSFTLQPGGKAVITFEAFCTEFGKVFPTRIGGPNGSLAPDAARAAMNYGVSKGYNANEQQALEFQYAIWQAIGTANSPQGGATTQDVLANGKTAPAAPQATSVLNAAQANQVRIILDSWQPIGDKVAITPTATDNFYGRGQLTVENTSQQALTLYMPVGTIFPAANAAEQTMAGYATNLQVQNPAPQLPATSGAQWNRLWLLLALVLFAASAMLRTMRMRSLR